MIEIRGGSVLFDDAAAGGLFVGVMFIEDDSSPEVVSPHSFPLFMFEGYVYRAGVKVRSSTGLDVCVPTVCRLVQLVNEAIMQTLTNTGMRIYGGHVYIATGQIRTYIFQIFQAYFKNMH
jgi:hypothetical protein